MADRFDSPVDVATELPGMALPGLAQMAVAVGIAAFGLLLLNAHALADWAGALEPVPRTAPIVNAADYLAEQTAARGLDRPRAALKSFWDDVKAARWPHEALPQDQRKKL